MHARVEMQGKRREGMAYRGCRDSCEPAFTIRNRSMEAAERETTARKEEKERETREKSEKGGRRRGETRREEMIEERKKKERGERERKRKEKPRVLSPMRESGQAKPKAERKVLSARSYLSLSVVALASGHDQSEVSIPGYQSAPSAYIIVRSLGHCLSTVVNHILFPRLRFRFIYLSEKRIATVLVAKGALARAPRALLTCTDGRRDGRAHIEIDIPIYTRVPSRNNTRRTHV